MYSKHLVSLAQERKVDIMRTLFHSSYSYSNEEDAKVAEQYRLYLKEDLGKQLMVVRGMDRESRAIVLKFPRQSSETTEEAFVTAQLYITERAIAATEALSEGREEKVVAIADFGVYSRSNAPPWSALRTVVHLLQPNYPERLDHLIILDAPFFMRALFNLIHPFLRAATKEKLVMIADDVSVFSKMTRNPLRPFFLPAQFHTIK
jgi:CRAL/TRIO domain